jgi:hypothetical protein
MAFFRRLAYASLAGLLLLAASCKPKEPTLILPKGTYPDPGPAVGVGSGPPPKATPASTPHTKPDEKPPN